MTRVTHPLPAQQMSPQQLCGAGRGRARPAGAQQRQRLRAHMALVWLLLALLWAPTLGRLHQVSHAPGLSHGTVAASGAAAVGTAGVFARSPSHAHGWLDALWAHPAQGAAVDCLLLDQLALGDSAHNAAPALPAASLLQPLATHRAQRPAAQPLALFQARGPPDQAALTV